LQHNHFRASLISRGFLNINLRFDFLSTFPASIAVMDQEKCEPTEIKSLKGF